MEGSASTVDSRHVKIPPDLMNAMRHKMGADRVNSGEGSRAYRVVTLTGLLALAFVSDTVRAADAPVRPVPAYDQSAIARRGLFYVDGGYVGEPGKQLMH